MLYDGITLAETSVIENLNVSRGNVFPSGTPGELFYKIGSGLHAFNGTSWEAVGGSSGGGGGSAEPLPSATTFTYTDGVLTSMIEVIAGSDKITTYDYTDGQITSVSTAYRGSTRTETFTYNAENNISAINVTEA